MSDATIFRCKWAACLLGALLASEGLAAPGSPYEVAWAKQPGKATHDLSHDVALDGRGGLYLATSFEAPISSLTTNYNAAISKYDLDGNLLWSRSVDDRNGELAYAIAADSSGNAYLAGLTDVVLAGEVISRDRQAFVRKYSPSGDLIWSERFDRQEFVEVNDIDVDQRGNVYLAGTTRKPATDSSPADTDAYVSRLNAEGELVWTMDFGTDDYDAGWAVSVDDMGGIFLSGSTRGSIGQSNFGGSDAFIIKLDEHGETLWASQFGSLYNDQSYAVQSDGEGGAYIGGYAGNPLIGDPVGTDAFVARIGADGSLTWQSFHEPGFARAVGSLAKGPDGSIYAAGSTEGMPRLGDAYVSKLSPQGVFEWTEQFGTGATDTASAVAVDAFEAVYVSGLTFGDLAGPHAGGGGDAFLVKFVNPIPEPCSVHLLLGASLAIGFRRSHHSLASREPGDLCRQPASAFHSDAS